MLSSLEAIRRCRAGDLSVLKSHRWLRHLYLTREHRANLERLDSLEALSGNPVLDYVERSLTILAGLDLPPRLRGLAEETLRWSEVAKAGMPHERAKWIARGINVHAHNEGSAALYLADCAEQAALRRHRGSAPDDGRCTVADAGEPADAGAQAVACLSADACIPEDACLGADACIPEAARLIADADMQAVACLIATHGLIGQAIRGETTLAASAPLLDLLPGDRCMTPEAWHQLLLALNRCIIEAVSPALWQTVEASVRTALQALEHREFGLDGLKDRLRLLRAESIRNGEDFDTAYAACMADPQVAAAVSGLLAHASLWYVEAALHDFTFEEFLKILLLSSGNPSTLAPDVSPISDNPHMLAPDVSPISDNPQMLAPDAPDASAVSPESPVDAHDQSARHLPALPRHISFEPLMRDLHRQHRGKKRVNLYAQRIISRYLADLDMHALLEGHLPHNPHVAPESGTAPGCPDTVFFRFRFSPAGSRLIDFCLEAEQAGLMYERAVMMLFDLFGLRRDAYDRFYDEERYLETMNGSIGFKKVLLSHVVGHHVLDIGPGGGALLDALSERFPDMRVTGVDIASNVLDALGRRKTLEQRPWHVQYGNALDLGAHFAPGSVDTIIFCSILHELFSYVPHEGRLFQHETLAAALRGAFAILPPGGRILIRDGIMTEPEDQMRIIRFRSDEGLAFLARYVQDFKGRSILYRIVGHNEVLLPVNDAMEFLYTYTWGEDSYAHEVNEQFGYFTPSGWRRFIAEVLGDKAVIRLLDHHLQDGYDTALAPKIELLDESRQPVRLPDSTCILVIEKGT